jgi:hypothetical protein
VSQISPPIRIVLAAAVIFLVAWMTVLKPKSDSAAPPAAPATTPAGNLATGKQAVSAPGKIVQKAQDAANTASKAGAAAAGESTTTESATGAATATKGATATSAKGTPTTLAALTGVPKPVANAIAKQKVVVLGLFDKQALDRDVRRSLAKIDRWNGRVFVKSVPLAQVGHYARITSGAQVYEAPSVVVIDRALHATLIPGFTDTVSIDQAVVDALRASGGLFTSPYLRKVNAACSSNHVAQAIQPGATRAQAADLTGFLADARPLTPPARYAALDKALVRDTVALRGALRSGSKAKAHSLDKQLSTRFHKHNLISCIDG